MNEETRQPSSDRRFFLKAGLAALAAAGAALVVGVGRFLKPKVVYEPPLQFIAGTPSEYPPGAVSTRFMDEQEVVIVHGSEGIYAMVTVCTHLGCIVNFDQTEHLFKCPCHGSVFALNGRVLGGPAPLPLARASLSLDPVGRIVVNKADTASLIDPASAGKFLIKGVA